MKVPFPRRKTFQYTILFFFILCIYLSDYPMKEDSPVDLFLKLDPLVLLSSVLSSKFLSPLPIMALSLLTLLSAILFGRVFCGYFCPMGTTLDILDPLVKPLAGEGRKGNREMGNISSLAEILLLFFIFTSLLSLNLAYFLDPIPLITRFYVTSLYPLAIHIIGVFLYPISWIGRLAGIPSLEYVNLTVPRFNGALAFSFLFLALLLLNAVRYRFFCRHLCPLGALLGLLSRFNIYRRGVLKGCNDCGLCQKRCTMSAIPPDARQTLTKRCITCYTCVRVCPEKAVSFTLGKGVEGQALSSSGISRREFIISAGGGIISASLVKTQILHQWRGVDPSPLRHQRIIRPPGTVPEPDFLKLCPRCGECFKVCPTNTIQPIWFEAGAEGLWTPSMHLRYSYCEQLCNLCGLVCPTGAIRALSLKERRYAKVGTAVIMRDTCWAWAYDRECLICDEHCPYNAIDLRMKRGWGHLYGWKGGRGEEGGRDEGRVRVPYVDPKRCNGCGVCENRCPVEGESAIVVVPDGEIRLPHGSYVETAGELGYTFEENHPYPPEPGR